MDFCVVIKPFIFLFTLLPFCAQAKVWTVDNSPKSAADSSSLQGIINLASSGDTIILMPSFTTYGNVSISKKLLIYSHGFSAHFKSHDKDRIPKLQTTTINTGGKGTVLAGLVIHERIYVNGDSCQLIYNNIQGSTYIQGNATLVEGNLFNAFYFYEILSISNGKNHKIQNNYISIRTNGSNLNNGYSILKGGDSSTRFRNNLVVEVVDNGGNISNGGIIFFLNSSARIQNNILWSNVSNRSNFQTGNSGSIFENNITYSANSQVDTLPGFNYNDTMPLFEGGYNNSFLPYYRIDNNLQLKSASPGKGGGIDNTDPGIFGRNYTYNMLGIPSWLLRIAELSIQNSILKQNQNIQVKVKIQP